MINNLYGGRSSMGDLLFHNMGQSAMTKPPRPGGGGGPDASGRYPGQAGYYGGGAPPPNVPPGSWSEQPPQPQAQNDQRAAMMNQMGLAASASAPSMGPRPTAPAGPLQGGGLSAEDGAGGMRPAPAESPSNMSGLQGQPAQPVGEVPGGNDQLRALLQRFRQMNQFQQGQ